MNGRMCKIKNWIETINNDFLLTYEVFDSNTISANDIGEKNMFTIINNLTELLTTMDDILFELENNGYG